jgi:aerobic carbon-monoxide dehydrogenase small subunit
VIVQVRINGEDRQVEVAGPQSLLTVLRDRLGLPGSKSACEQGECGSCSVFLDGELVCSCLVMAADTDGSEVVTVEGLGTCGELTDVQQAMLDSGGVQCGFCTPGFVMAATDLFERDPTPSRDRIREELSGNLCRCTGYGAILRGLGDLSDRRAGSEAPS